MSAVRTRRLLHSCTLFSLRSLGKAVHRSENRILFCPFFGRSCDARQQESPSTRTQDEHSSLITVSFEGNGEGNGGGNLFAPFPRLQTANDKGFPYKEKTTLPEACDDVCEFVSVTSFGVTCEDNSLLRRRPQLFSPHTKLKGTDFCGLGCWNGELFVQARCLLNP